MVKLHLKHNHASKELTPLEFAYAFSLYRDVFRTAFPSWRQELDTCMAIILDLALLFGGTSFYHYHMQFASEAATRLQQFNQEQNYCHVFAAHSLLSCKVCGVTSVCIIPSQNNSQPISRTWMCSSHKTKNFRTHNIPCICHKVQIGRAEGISTPALFGTVAILAQHASITPQSNN